MSGSGWEGEYEDKTLRLGRGAYSCFLPLLDKSPFSHVPLTCLCNSSLLLLVLGRKWSFLSMWAF